jgi:FkbM family methyltransferase
VIDYSESWLLNRLEYSQRMLRIAGLAGILKPEYLFRPNQIPRKLWLECLGRREEIKKARLPWGLEIRVNTGESIGWSIYTRALYETAVTESLWRLARAGDIVVDVGANIGYMTSILAIKVGPRGKVYSFEPHPGTFEELQLNAANWSADKRCGQFVLHNAALGDRNGSGKLHVPDYFNLNQGTSWIGPPNALADSQMDVGILALDDVVPDCESIGVIKIDVQGYELSVLKGMERLLRERRCRHIVFEEENPFPALTHTFLSDMSYVIYGIEQRFGGVRYARNQQPYFDPVNGPSPNYLATIESEAEVS